MFFILVDWTCCGSSEEDQHIGPFLTRKDAEEWGHQIIGDPEGLPWSVEPLDAPVSCVKQFRNQDAGPKAP